jgi:tRNA (mo5U34)-methyltransferase
MDIGDFRTRGHYDPSKRIGRLGLDESLVGKSVLDVGAWDGFYSFEAERRGAASVFATDHYCWSGEGWGSRDGFDAAHKILGSKVIAIDVEPHDLHPEMIGGKADIVLFLGVLYHLPDPMSALRALRTVTGDQLIIETLGYYSTRQPLFRAFRQREWEGDPTTYSAASPSAIEIMLRAAGFHSVEVLWSRGRATRLLKALRALPSFRWGALRDAYLIDRVVLHAR